MALETAGVDARPGLAPGLGDADAATRRDARRVVAIDVAARDEGTEAEMPIAVIISATNARVTRGGCPHGCDGIRLGR